jgi:hypothetical protein
MSTDVPRTKEMVKVSIVSAESMDIGQFVVPQASRVTGLSESKFTV